VADPQAAIFDLMYGRWRSQTLYAGVKLGIFEATDRESKAATAVAAELGLDRNLSYRLLLALGSIELLQEHDDRRFSLSATGALLKSDHPQSLQEFSVLGWP
jgi:hypothetical protein